MRIGAFDIETIPSQSLPEECVPQFDPQTVKLGNTKDPAKVKAKIQEAKGEFEKDLTKKMSLDPDLCQVCMFVGYLYDTDEGSVVSKTVSGWDPDEEDYMAVYDLGLGWVSGRISKTKNLVRFAHNWNNGMLEYWV